MIRPALLLLTLCIATGALAQKSGVLDRTFGINGIASTPLAARGITSCIQVLDDDRILLYGQQHVFAGAQLPVLIRYTPNGRLDSTFGTGGKAILFASLRYFTTYKIIIQPDKKILATGGIYDSASQTVNAFVFRCLSNGFPDSSFGNSGIVIVPMTTASNYGADLGLHTNGRITVVGQALDTATGVYLVGAFRLMPNGVPDTSFSSDGITTIAAGSSLNNAASVVVRPDNRILIGGNSGNNLLFLQLKADGTPDATFAPSGRITYAFDDINRVSKIMLDAAGRIVFSANLASINNRTDTYPAVGRLRANGSLDTSFAHSGIFVVNSSHLSSYFPDFLIDKDSNIVCLGMRNAVNPANHYLLKINGKGVVQTYFGTTGYATDTADIGGASIGLQSDNKIIVGGALHFYQDTSVIALVRYSNQLPAGVMAQQGEQYSITVYPVPANDLVRVTFNKNGLTGQYWITDMEGRTILQKGVTLGSGIQVNVSGIPEGLYFMHVVIGDKVVIRPLMIAR